jgi:hypothetical protein
MGTDQHDDGDMVDTVGSDQTCTVCGMNGQDLKKCHLFINILKGLDFIKSFPDAVSKIHQSHRTCIHHNPRPASGIHHIGESTSYGDQENAAPEDDQPSHNFDEKGYIYHLNYDTVVEAQYDVYVPEYISFHIDPFGSPVIHFINDDCNYDPAIDDLIIANIGDSEPDDVYVSSFTSATDETSTYEDVIGLIALEGIDTQEIGDTSEKVQLYLLILPAGPANRS